MYCPCYLVLVLLISTVCPSSYAIILMEKGELFALLKCLSYVIFPDRTHLLFHDTANCVLDIYVLQ